MSTRSFLSICAMYQVGKWYMEGVRARKSLEFAMESFQLDVAARAAAFGAVYGDGEPEWARKRLNEGYRTFWRKEKAAQ